MIGDALEQANQIAVVVAEGRRARQERYLRVASSSRTVSRDPLGRGHAVDRRILADEAAAETRVLVADDHTRAGARQPRGPPRGPPARRRHEHVAVRVRVLVAIGIGRDRRAAHARGARGSQCS